MNANKIILPLSKAINTQINLPASKSISNRALILNALSYSPYSIANLSESDDTKVMLSIFNSNDNLFDIGAAGTAMRFLTAYLAKTVGKWEITGSERMQQRPIKILVDALNQLGGKIEYVKNDGFPPLRIYGSRLMGGDLQLDGSVSSQYISALMMIAPYMQNGLKLHLKGNLISRPYVDMTKKMMQDFGVRVHFSENTINIKPQTYSPTEYSVESDWSAASYWYQILAVMGKGKVLLKGLLKNSYQGDRQVADIFKRLGIMTDFKEKDVLIYIDPNFETLPKIFRYDFTDTPDLAQTLAVTCCVKNIPFEFTGLQSLRIKETDRILAIQTELKKIGYLLQVKNNNTLTWNGNTCPTKETPIIETYQDHRMAMAFAPAGMVKPLAIKEPHVVSKSYPRFWDDFDKIYH